MDQHYKRIFTGNSIMAQRIVEKLQEIGITPVVKDESKSALLAGFASAMQGDQELYVNSDEAEEALKIVASVLD